MRTTRSTGFIAVTLTITLLAIEAVAVLGLARVASSWTPSRVAALARAGATTWSALTRSAQHAVVSRTLPAALAAVRTTTEMMRAAQGVLPGTGVERPQSPGAEAPGLAIARTSVRPYTAVHACPNVKVATRVVCTKVTRSHAARKALRTS